MKVLAIDFGEARIGLAVAVGTTGDQESRPFAVPLETLERKTDRIAIAQLAEIVDERQVEALVVGLPLGLSGQRNEACERVQRFADKLAKRTRLPLYFVNESLTSSEASGRLREAGLKTDERAQSLDALSAALILQEWIDQQRDTKQGCEVGCGEGVPR